MADRCFFFCCCCLLSLFRCCSKRLIDRNVWINPNKDPESCVSTGEMQASIKSKKNQSKPLHTHCATICCADKDSKQVATETTNIMRVVEKNNGEQISQARIRSPHWNLHLPILWKCQSLENVKDLLMIHNIQAHR